MAVAGAAIALVTYFLPHHTVYDTGFGEALGCLFLPDCHATPSPGPRGPGVTHSGYAHSGILVPVLLLCVLVTALAALSRRRLWASVGTSVVALVLAGGTAVALFDLAHMFDKVVSRWAETVFGLAMLALLGATLVVAIATPFLYIAARRRLRA